MRPMFSRPTYIGNRFVMASRTKCSLFSLIEQLICTGSSTAGDCLVLVGVVGVHFKVMEARSKSSTCTFSERLTTVGVYGVAMQMTKMIDEARKLIW